MAISGSNLTSGNAASATSFVTASVAPTANALVIITVSSNATSPNQPTITGASGTWTVIYRQTDGGARTVTTFRDLSASPGSGALTIDFAGQTQSVCNWSVDQFTGTDTTGTHGSGAIVQSGVGGTSTGTSTGETQTLAALGSANNAAFSAVRINNVGASLTKGANFTSLSTPTGNGASLGVEYAINQTACNFTWTSTNLTYVAQALEIKADVSVITAAAWANPVDYYSPIKLRRQSVDDLGTFVEFPFAPAATPTSKPLVPDELRYIPIRKTEGFIQQGWQPVLTPAIWQQWPDDWKYQPLKKTPVDPEFTEFPFAPSATPTWSEPNPSELRYIPIRKTEGFITTGWQPVLTPANWFPNADDPRYLPLKKTDAFPGFVEFPGAPSATPTWSEPNPVELRYVSIRKTEGFISTGWQPVLTPAVWQQWPDDPKYQPLRRTEGPTGFVEFPFAPAVTPTGKWPNPDDPRYQQLRRVDGLYIFTPGQIPATATVVTTLLANPSVDFWKLRVVDGSLFFVEFPFAPATTPIKFSPNPVDYYKPLRRTEGSTTQGWQPVLTPAVRLIHPDDPKYIQLHRTEGFTTQGWQPVLTPAVRLIHPDDPRYIQIRKTEGFTTQGWQPVLTPAVRLIHPDDPRYIQIRKTEGFTTQGWQQQITLPNVSLILPDDPKYIQLRRLSVDDIGQFTPYPFAPSATPTWSEPNPDSPRYIPLRTTEGYNINILLPSNLLTRVPILIQSADDPRYIPLRRITADYVRVAISFNGEASYIVVSDNEFYRVVTTIDGELWVAQENFNDEDDE